MRVCVVGSGGREHPATFSQAAAVTVICASEGYPTSPRTGDHIKGLEAARPVEGMTVDCAGVADDATGALVTAGGRVLNVTALAPTLTQNRDRAYQAVARLSWPGMQYRSDIALSASTTPPGAAAPTLTPTPASSDPFWPQETASFVGELGPEPNGGGGQP